MGKSYVSLTVDYHHIARIIIQRPEALNALNSEVLTQLHEVVKQISANPQIRVVVVSSLGDKAFVAGADIKEMCDLSPAQAKDFAQKGLDAFAALEQLPQVSIAQIQGFALGGGLELALACDILVASDKAILGFPEVTLGLIPGFAGTQRLSRKTGRARALEWICSAGRYTAAQALTAGVVEHVVPPEQLQSSVDTLALTIAKHQPGAVRAAKAAVDLGMHSDFLSGCAIENAYFALRFSDSQAKDSMSAFVTKSRD